MDVEKKPKQLPMIQASILNECIDGETPLTQTEGFSSCRAMSSDDPL